MDRREFVTAGLAAGVGAAIASSRTARAQEAGGGAGGGPFKLKYAPHFGMFKNSAGRDPIDQIKFMADQGFRAIEDNGMRRKSPELQERIRKELDRHGMEMGVFVAHGDFGKVTFAGKEVCCAGTAAGLAETAKAAMDKVTMTYQVGDQKCNCPVEADKLAKDSSDVKVFVVGDQVTACDVTARLNLAL